MAEPKPTTKSRDSSQVAPPAEDHSADPYLKSMALGLIEDSYLHTGTFTQFAAEVMKVMVYAVTVPVAFTEGFLKSYLSISRIDETDDGTITIIPKADASEEDWIREVNEITAQVDPSAVFNPVVRSKLDAVHQTSSKAMKYDLNELATMSDDKLMDVLRQMQRESEELSEEEVEAADREKDYIRAKLDTIRRNVRAFQAQQKRPDQVSDEGLSEASGPTAGDAGPGPGSAG
jgi:hypothetical protein